MSERLTTASAPGVPGLSLNGRRTRAEAIAAYRKHYQGQLGHAQTALAVADEQITVQTYLGAWARKKVEDVTE